MGHSSQAVWLARCLLRDSFAIQIGSHVAEPQYRLAVKQDGKHDERARIYHERASEREYLQRKENWQWI